MKNPNVLIIGGANGAGKSTISRTLLSGAFGKCHYVNADAIARGLSAFHADEMALKAGRVMLEHLCELAADRVNFAFETTLGSRTFARWIAELKQTGYKFHLILRVGSVGRGQHSASASPRQGWRAFRAG